MRSTRTTLEQAVIDAARDVTPGLFNYSALTESAKRALLDAVTALDAHLADVTDARGAFVPGSATSENAAVLGRLAAGSLRRRIVDEVRSIGLRSFDLHGLTDDELERRLHRPHTSVSSARNWLCQHGWLTDTGCRRLTVSNREAIVWGLTPAAHAKVTSPEWIERSKA